MDKLQKILLQLKDLGCCCIKISYEHEGALLNEIISMRYLTASIGLGLSIKIGGCEAKRDIVDCIDIGCDTIVAPMVDSSFALNKFLNSLNQYGYCREKGFNLETINAFNCLDELSRDFSKLDFVTVGRVDFVRSLNKNITFVDTDEMFEMVKKVFIKARENNTKCYLGGAISIDSKDFIGKLLEEKLLDKFETRYVIFDCQVIDFNKLDELFYLANVFEVEWLKYINSKYTLLANKDLQRIKMLESKEKELQIEIEIQRNNNIYDSLKRMSEDLEKKDNELEIVNKQIFKNEQLITNLKNENDSLKITYSNNESKFNEQIKSLNKLLNYKCEMLESKEKELQIEIERNNNINDSLKKNDNQLEIINKQIFNNEQLITNLKNENDFLKDINDSLKITYSNNETNFNEQIKSLNKLLNYKCEMVESKEKELQIEVQRNKNINDSLKRMSEELKKNDISISILDNQIDDLKNVIINLNALNTDLRNELHSKNDIISKKDNHIEILTNKLKNDNLFDDNLFDDTQIIHNNKLSDTNNKLSDTIYMVYQYKYTNNCDVTGIGDFIRGCFYILQMKDIYKFNTSIIINKHPIKKYLQHFSTIEDLTSEIESNIYFFKEINHKYIVNNGIINYQHINIEDKFLTFIKRLPNLEENKYMYLINHPKEDNITSNHKNIIKTLFSPTEYISNIVDLAINNLNFEKGKFNVLHARMSDKCFSENEDNEKNNMNNIITNFFIIKKFLIDNHSENPILVISNSIQLKKLLIANFPNMKTIFHEICHIADSTIINDDSKIINTLKEFFIMSHASNIYSFSVYEHGSGFSKWCAKMYDIPYKCMKLQ